MTTMKLLCLLLAAVVAVSARHSSVTALRMNNNVAADSPLGIKLLSKARRLEDRDDEDEDRDENEEEEDRDEDREEEDENDRDEENEEGNENGGNADNYDISWVAGYSLKFQGCHHIRQWNADADEDNDVKIITKRLVRFRLCPTSSCSSEKAAGCKSGYGDYIMDLEEYLAYYYEARQQMNGGDGGDEDLENYLACAQVGAGDDDEGKEYFVGPYCSQQGGEVFLGMFTDDACTEPASVSFESIQGSSLPYESESIIGSDCFSCAEMADGNDNGNDGDGVAEQCEAIYYNAGKCESNLPNNMVDEKNTQACNYMDGIKIVREDGVIMGRGRKPSAAATAFIVIFAMLFAAMAFYVWYLRMRLGVKKNSLL